MVAVHLKKWGDFEADAKGRELELRYFRGVQGREADFVIVENREPIRFIECKWKDEAVHPALRYARPRADLIDDDETARRADLHACRRCLVVLFVDMAASG